MFLLFCFCDVLKLLFACILSKRQPSPLTHTPPAGWAFDKVGANTYWQCSFFYQMSIVSDECIYFWACPHLFKEFAQSVSLRWRQDPPFFCFSFWISSWESKIRHDIAINHILWTFMWDKGCIYSSWKEMVYGIHCLLSYIRHSVGFLLLVIHYGWFFLFYFFCPCCLEFSLTDCTHWWTEL